jgi:myo-inositol catabolism protein IolC
MAEASAQRELGVTPRGYDCPLYVLPFDHRRSFQTKMFGWRSPLSEAQTEEIASAKRVIYDGFKSALTAGVSKEKAGILVDEQFGAAILREAAANNVVTACPAEKSGQKEFDFEYGDDFTRHIEAFDPTFCKVLVRYNPQGDRTLNRRQAARLKRLSDFLVAQNRSRFMFELLVPPEKAQLDEVQGDSNRYDREIRARLMVEAIHELQDAGVEPDLWKLEGLDRRDDCEEIVAAARRFGRDRVSCIVLGRGADDQKVRNWLAVAANVPGFVGFAVGRTVFWEAVAAWRSKQATREQTVIGIADRYRQFVDIFEKSIPRTPVDLSGEIRTEHRSSMEA